MTKGTIPTYNNNTRTSHLQKTSRKQARGLDENIQTESKETKQIKIRRLRCKPETLFIVF